MEKQTLVRFFPRVFTTLDAISVKRKEEAKMTIKVNSPSSIINTQQKVLTMDEYEFPRMVQSKTGGSKSLIKM